MEPVTEVGEEPAVRLVRRYGKYETIARIGTGGMAEVFLARQLGPMRFEKIVVLKTIHDHLASQREFIDMLLDEARIAALLKHPHVVDIYDLGEEEGTYFIAMEYVAGESLSQVIRAGRKGERLDIFSSASVIAECAEGLHAAHDLHNLSGEHINLVHRDVTPGNIMVLYGGDVKLVDFGVAKARGRVVETGARKLKGKLGYVSPEQLDGVELDRRSDIFSLGVVMWETLALRRLFRADSEAAVVRAILAGNVTPPSSINDSIPAELDAICLKALAFKREERYQTAAEMQADIQAFLRSSNFYESQRQISAFMKRSFARNIVERGNLLKRVARADTSTGQFPIIEALENPALGTDELSGERLIEEATEVKGVGADGTARVDERAKTEAVGAPAGDGERRLPLEAPPSTGVHSFDDVISGRTQGHLESESEGVEIAFDAIDPTGVDTSPAPIEDEPTTVDDSSVEIIEEIDPPAESIATATAAAETILADRRAGRSGRLGTKAALGLLLVAGLVAAFVMARRENRKGDTSETTAQIAAMAGDPNAKPGLDPTVARGDGPVANGGDDTAVVAEQDAAAAEPAAEIDLGADDTLAPTGTEDIDIEPSPAGDSTGDPAGDPAGDSGDNSAAVNVESSTQDLKSRPTPRDKAPVDKGPTGEELTAEGQRLYISGNYDGAIAKFRAAAKKGDAAAHRGMGLVYEKLAKNAKAIAAFKNYLRQAPRASDADAIRARIAKLGG